MNIHIKDIESFEAMKMASLAQCQFGSVLYKTNDEFSDVDIHYVYATSVNELNSFLKSHHHLQYKEEGKDHIFVSLHTFLHNLLRGDSTVLFEIVHSDAFKNTPLSFLNDMKDAFTNYAMVRSYLGFARRDCQHYHKAKGHREQIKSLGHIFRGYYFAQSILDGNFRLINDDFLAIFAQLKAIGETDFVEKKRWLTHGQKIVTELREELNEKFNNNTLNLPKYMSIENQVKLDREINNLMKQPTAWFTKQECLSKFDLSPFYDAFENEITY
jgi:predicted nucleotidyltransferase